MKKLLLLLKIAMLPLLLSAQLNNSIITGGSGGSVQIDSVVNHTTGDYSPWDTNGAIIQKDTNLNVGIGTITPEAKLHVSISDTTGIAIAHFENNIDNALVTLRSHADSSAILLLQTGNKSAVFALTGVTGEVVLTNGLAVNAIEIDTNNNVTIPDLAGSGKRLVTASATGVLDTSSTEEVLYFTKVTLSSSELLAGADVTVIPAVPNKIIRLDPFLSFSKYVHNTTAYVGATGLSLRLDGGTTGVATTAANWQTSTTKRTQLLGTTPIATTINFLVGQPLEVTFPGGALTTGDGTVVLYLYYTLVND